MLAYEIARQFTLTPTEVETPLEKTGGGTLDEPVTLVAILRAALGLVDGMATYLPHAKIGHLGMYRDEQTLQPVHYYTKVPADIHKSSVILADPMLATGGSIVAGLDFLAAHGCTEKTFVVCLLAAPEGIDAVRARYEHVPIYTAVVDRELNDKGFILPGLGDAGDRQYGTL